MERLLLEAQKNATLESVRELRHLLEQVIQVAVPHLQLQQQMLLCLSEAATNLVIHTDPQAGQISIKFGHNNYGWWLDILDDAAPWDPGEAVQSELLDTFSEAENGRGTALLKSQCDHIEYHSGDNDELNRLRLGWDNPSKSRRPSILIVEDDNALRRLYTAYLDDTYDVVTATDGQKAMQLLSDIEIDLVLSDIQMPEMSGLTLREYLSEQRKTELIPFIFLTGDNSSTMQNHAVNLGIDDYLLKPVDKTQLLHSIQRVLNRSRQVYRQLTDRIDKSITSALAPTLPESIHGWRLCVASRHTGVGGGDLLLHRNDDDQLMLALVDIMGHDDSAKFFAYAYGGYLRGLMQANDDISPEQLLEKLSENALQDSLLSQVILTGCTATLSSDGKITLASAGHPSPLRITPAGVEMIQVGGMLPGLMADTRYDAEILELTAGERIVLYTDGLFESAADNASRKDLETQITSSLIDTLNIPIEESLQQVMEVFDSFAGSPPKDDALLLLIERLR